MLDKLFNKNDAEKYQNKANQLEQEIAEMTPKYEAYKRNLDKLQADYKTARTDYQLELISKQQLENCKKDVDVQTKIIDDYSEKFEDKKTALDRLRKEVLPKLLKEKLFDEACDILDKMILISKKFEKATNDFSFVAEMDSLSSKLHNVNSAIRYENNFTDMDIFASPTSLNLSCNNSFVIIIEEFIDKTKLKALIEKSYMSHFSISRLEYLKNDFKDGLFGDRFKFQYNPSQTITSTEED